MYGYTLDSGAPNQSFKTVVDGHRFDIDFHSAMGLLFATVKVDGEVVKTSGRCIEGQWIAPYQAYMPDECGNFMFVTRDEQYPEYSTFNTQCVLVYYTKEEMEAYENGD